MAGEYPTRDQQADARKEAGAAYEHYKERFRRIFADFGGDNVGEKVAGAQEKVAGAAEKVADWLRPRRDLAATGSRRAVAGAHAHDTPTSTATTRPRRTPTAAG